MSTTTIQTREDERHNVVAGDRFVSITRDYLDRGKWRRCPESGVIIPREHLAVFIAAMANESNEQGSGNG